VETREEEAEIQQLGGALLQGFLFSRPLPEYQVPAWLAR
jgi:EAL domain-containing protein (putative c-di-GMP-specific phosphodiesterase class I)